MARERLVVPLIVSAFLAYLSLFPSLSRAQTEDGVVRRIEVLEKRIAELERELNQVRIQLANDRLLDRLRGKWKETSFIEEGKMQREEDDVLWDLTTDVNSVRTLLAGEVSQHSFGRMTVDTTKDPVWITFHDRDAKGKERTWPGLVVLRQGFTGGYLETHVTIALPLSRSTGRTGMGRPEKLESTEKNGVMLFELEKAGHD